MKSPGAIVGAMYAANIGGMIAHAAPEIRGQTMAMHALFSAAAAFLLPIAFGVILDLGGGEQSRTAWTWAFGAMAVLILVGPIALFTLDRD